MAPSYEDQIAGYGFAGRAGAQFWADMERFVGLTREDFYVSSFVKEGLAKGKKAKPADVAASIPEFLEELDTVQPRIIVTVGGPATRAVLGDSAKLANVHGIPHPVEIAGRQYICHPVYPAVGAKGFLAAFAYDLKQLKMLLDGEITPWVHTVYPAFTEAFLSDMGPFFHPSARVVAVDTEGWKEYPWGLSFSPDGKHGYVIPAHSSATHARAWFARWLEGKTVVFHNGLHDIPVLNAMGIGIGDYHDTQVLAYHDMIRSGSGVLEAESQNLGTLAYRECRLQLGELTDCAGVDLATRTIPYTDEVCHYAGMDPIATWRLFDIYQKRGLVASEPYTIDMSQTGLVGQMIANGIPFEADDAVSYYTEVIDKLDAVTKKLKAAAARFGNREFNPGSHPQVREIITRKIGLRIRKRTKGGLASTNEKALADHQTHPFVQTLQEHRELVKLRGTYIVPLLDELLGGL